MNLFLRRTLIIVLSVCLPSLGSTGARRPPNVAPIVSEENVTWFHDGEAIPLTSPVINDKLYLPIEQLARLSGSQLRWQAVTQQACLGNVDGLLCFNWGDSRITRDGRTVRGKYPLRFENDDLLVPLEFAASKEFANFSKSRIQWDKEKKELTQNSPLNLEAPVVERMDDRYRVTVRMPVVVPHYLLEKTDDRIWIRFVRAQSEGSQIFEGDQVLKEIKIVQKRHSADMQIMTGPLAASNEVFFDSDEKSVIIDIYTQPGVITKEAPIAKADAPAQPPASAKKEKKKVVRGKIAIPVKSVAVTKPISATVSAPAATATRRVKDSPIRTIVIDPGHGGMDSGAVGVRGTMEKTINLEAAKALAKQLSQNKNFRVILTRNSDEFIPLSQRTAMANQAKADVFISIHCNSSLSARGNGFEAYVLSPDATDKAAESVARLENSVVALEAKKGAHASKLEELLASMAVHNYINESSKFAGHVCRFVKSRSINEKAHVREADFYVLRGAQMPALLIELEYLSNPISELKLRSSRYRSQLAKSISEGVSAYARQVQKEAQAMATQGSPDLDKN